ncbi:flagellar transcriptional regulator FlhD [Oceanisphaera arctica]|jgi:flagellar transcriptional activator FlhD|uniref:Flagellar transcriptional regulator FlhD n=1 Tax=Oceanisphaera arctica TaxID=641510 RepID=A0A2P5TMS8_9GAMM|nr:flagellar transcriptional regulator FlhD [Oceanisphaera arctica]PPL16737.1 flagellar transcriptional regulator FlhD [Oceanisphaera arctica]GHA06201.1 flagellar transcriptional regulator FlhD [Oceanisphaera arctica]
METNSILDEIQELNLSYLLLVKRLLNDDKAMAMYRLKMDEPMADLLLSLSARELSRLARMNQLICRPNFEHAEQLEKLLRNPREQGLTQTHLALLMASV